MKYSRVNLKDKVYYPTASLSTLKPVVSEIPIRQSLPEDGMTVITLTLLHPLQSIPVQSWPFENESVIRIGRSNKNDVILYSAVVSRYHVEIRRNHSDWEVVNLGANGTYVDGKRMDKVPVVNGMVIRLASSGPQIRIHLEGTSESELKLFHPSKRNLRLKDKTEDTFVS